MGSIPWWVFLTRIVVLYVLVMVALRIMGQREIGQLSVFDFVVSVMMAELSTLPMEETDVPIYRSFVSIGSLVVLQLIVSYISLKSHRFRHWVEGEPTVLVEHGRIKDSAMRKIRYSTHDLLTQLREKGFGDVADVEFAILETSGQLSVIPTAEKRPLTAQDLGVKATPGTIPMPLVVDGTPVEKTLRTLGKDQTWLDSELKRLGCRRIEDAFFATIDEHGTVQVDLRDEV